MEWLRKKISKPIIFLNGAEVEHENPNEVGAAERHRSMNKVLSHFIEKNKETCTLIDVRKYVTSRENLTNNIRHYQRNVYVSLARELMLLTVGRDDVKVQSLWIEFLKRVFNKLKRLLKLIVPKLGQEEKGMNLNQKM